MSASLLPSSSGTYGTYGATAYTRLADEDGEGVHRRGGLALRDGVSYAAVALAVTAALVRAAWTSALFADGGAEGEDASAARVSVLAAWTGALAFVLVGAVQVRSAQRHELHGATVPLVFWAVWLILAAVKVRTLVLTGEGGNVVLGTFCAAAGAALLCLIVEAFPRTTARQRERWHRRRLQRSLGKAAQATGASIQDPEAVASFDDDDDDDDDGEGSDAEAGKSGGADERTALLAGAGPPPATPSASGRRLRPRSAYEHANIYSRIVFHWLGGVIARGRRKGKIEAADVPEVPDKLRADGAVYRLVAAWRHETERVAAATAAASALAASLDPVHRRPSEDPVPPAPSLRGAVWSAVRWQFLSAAPLRLGQDVLAFAQPLLLEQLLLFIEAPASGGAPPARGYLIATAMFVAAVGQTLLSQQYFNACFETVVHIRSGLVGLIFAKALRQANHARLARTTGETVNHMAIDAQRIGEFANFAHNMWSSPLQIAAAVVLLYLQLKGAVFVGLAVLLLLMPLDVVLSRRLKARQKGHMRNKDQRLRIVDELLQGIKMVKLYAWEAVLLKRLNAARAIEVASLRDIFFLLTLQMVLWASGPALVTVASLGTYVAVYDTPLTPTSAFVSLTLFALLQAPLAALPATIAAAIDASVAITRLNAYLDTPEHESSPADWGLPPTPPDPDAARRTAARRPLTYEEATAATVAATLPPRVGVIGTIVARVTAPPAPADPSRALPPALAGWAGLSEDGNANNLVKATTTAYIRDDVPPRGTHGPAGRVSIYGGRFFWQPADPTAERRSGKTAPVLDDITFDLPAGGLTAVIGGVGSGKSALIAALLGEVIRDDGVVTVVGRIAYVPQQAWILNATVRDNILFGLPYDAARYNEVVTACALDADLAVLPAGDATEIGERGINLSGGQRQRVSLARAVYARADVYLLDDPLSAVDAHVSRHLFEHVLGPHGMLKGRTRLINTHDLAVLPSSDWIIALRGGRIAEQGTWAKLSSVVATRAGAAVGKQLEVAAAAAVAAAATTPDATPIVTPDAASGVPTTAADAAPAMGTAPLGAAPLESLAALAAVFDITTFKPTPPQRADDRVIDAPEPVVVPPPATPAAAAAAAATPTAAPAAGAKTPARAGKLMRTEGVQTGAVATAVYRSYASAVGWRPAALVVGLLAAGQAALLGASIWLQMWASDPSNNSELALYLGVYALLSIVQVGLLGASTGVASVVAGLGAAQRLYEDLVDNVVHATMAFFDTTPAGRTLNRFAKDVDAVDLNLPRAANSMMRALFAIVGILVAITVATPWFALAVLPLFWAVYAIQQYFLVAKRDLKRLDSVSRSPVIAHFAETLQGIASLRAYDAVARFREQNLAHLENNQRSYFYSIACNRWLATRLELLGAIIVLLAAVLAVAVLGPLDAALAGLSISFALQITGALSTLSRTWAEVESHIIAVERLVEYNGIPREAPLVLPGRRAPVGWPSGGALSLVAYSTRYRPELDLVLRDVTFSVRAGEKVGVVGRTGSGKSSLLLAITRLLEPVAGRIEIDGLNVGPGQLGLTDLRSHVVVVPQEPLLFSGTIRSNLDPWGQQADERLWWALTSVQLEQFVRNMPLGLEHAVVQGGENLSAGQRQLLCLARALLIRTRLLLLDEATSAIDVETDRHIQAMLRETFVDTTVVTIAHRIHTVLDSDRIIVLDHGAVVESDTPRALLDQPASAFAQLVASSKKALK